MATVALGALAAAGHFIGGVIGWWHLYEVAFRAGKPVLQASTTDAKSRKLPRLSMVVLPLVSEGDGKDGAWLADNLSADLVTELGWMSGALVISRETAYTYKGKVVDPREVSRELRVRYVVSGTVRREGDRVRLKLTMVDGESGAQHWAQQFEIDRTRLGQSIGEVAAEVGGSLRVQLLRSEGKKAAALKPEEVDADDLAMQGWEIWYRGINRENALAAQRLFEAAVARDPNSIRGWGGVGLTSWAIRSNGWGLDKDAANRPLQVAASRLQVLDQEDETAFAVRLFAMGWAGDWEGNLVTSKAMVERYPNSPGGHAFLGAALMYLGRFEECVEPAKNSIRLSPRDQGIGTWKNQLALCYFFRGEYPKATEYARAALQASPNMTQPQLVLAASLAREGRVAEARSISAGFREAQSRGGRSREPLGGCAARGRAALTPRQRGR